MTKHNSKEVEEKYLTEGEVGEAVLGIPACIGNSDVDIPNHKLAVAKILEKQLEKAGPLFRKDVIRFINSRVSFIQGILTTDISQKEWNKILEEYGLPPLPEGEKP